MKIIDKFLPEKEFDDIQSLMMGGDFPWYICTLGMVEEDDGGFQFGHIFLEPSSGLNSDFIEMWRYFMGKIGAKRGYCRIKANLTLKTPTPEKSLFHTDYQHGDEVDLKTSIFYINTNNGYTEFKNGVIVNSVANRLCTFDSNLEHRGVTHTEGDHQRVVMNFNYE